MGIRGLVAGVLLLGAACGTPQISSGGARVTASESPPPVGCVDVGDVTGRAGGQFSGTFVDGDALVGSALNDIRNAAARRGGDYVYIGKPQLGVYDGATRSASFGGRAYRCVRGPTPS